MKHAVLLALISLVFSACGPGSAPAPTAAPALKPGSWHVEMASPGGPLPFTLQVTETPQGLSAVVVNGEEHLALDRLEVTPPTVRFGLDTYESYFDGTLDASGTHMSGTWRKVIGTDRHAVMPFTAVYGVTERFAADPAATPADMAGTWAVTFDGNGKPGEAVGVFRQNGTHLEGTFLTSTGDYRYLEGVVDGRKLYLSCFDGGHAFLFSATLDEDGSLSGDFWSRDTWHETWTATRNPDAALPDPYSLTGLQPGLKQFRFAFPDLDGALVDQDASFLKDKVRLITIFGSWCPNCNDEAPFLQKLYDTYGDRGLEIVGLAFEMTGDTARDTTVLQRFRKRHGITYTTLLTGVSPNKQVAAEAMPDLQHVLSFPTTLLVNRAGEVVFVHTGFLGPGTGVHYEKQSEEYVKAIEAVL